MSNDFFGQRVENIEKSVIGGIRTSLGLAGLAALIIGVLILIWPVKSAVVVAGLVAVYLFIAGVVSIAVGVFSGRLKGWARIGYFVLGVLFIIAAVIALLNLGVAAVTLAMTIAIVLGVIWIVEGIVGLSMLGDSASKGWTAFYSILSIVAGIVLLFSPLWSAAILWLLLGISLVVLGVVQIIRAFSFGRRS